MIERYKRKFKETELKETSNFRVALIWNKQTKTFHITTANGNNYLFQDYNGMLQSLRILDAKTVLNNVVDADQILSMAMDQSFNYTIAILIDPSKFRRIVEL